MGYAHGEVLVVLILAEGRRGVLALEVQGLAVVHSREQALPCAHQTASDSELAQVRQVGASQEMLVGVQTHAFPP